MVSLTKKWRKRGGLLAIGAILLLSPAMVHADSKEGVIPPLMEKNLEDGVPLVSIESFFKALVSHAKPTSVSSALTADETAAKEWIAQKESGGSYTAQNGQYYGRYQLTQTYLKGDFSVENQERVADAYVTERYGNWVSAKTFWLENGWY